MQRMLDYMGLKAGQKIAGTPVDVVFIGSCTNSRIEDLRMAAQIAAGRKVAPGVRAMIVPGSATSNVRPRKKDWTVFFWMRGLNGGRPGAPCAWHEPDRLTPGQRCASTSNRNFEGRQGPGGRTHLLSPAMAAAAAVTGCLTDVRELA